MANFQRLFGDARLWKVFANTSFFAVFAVMGNVGLGVVLAVLLNRKMPRTMLYIYRAAYFFPSLVGLIFVSVIWQFLFQRDIGIINYYLGLLGVGPVSWLSNSAHRADFSDHPRRLEEHGLRHADRHGGAAEHLD